MNAFDRSCIAHRERRRERNRTAARDMLARLVALQSYASRLAHARAQDADTRIEIGIGCRVGIGALGGLRGDVVAFVGPIYSAAFRGDADPCGWIEIETRDGRSMSVHATDVWAQRDDARPWSHDGWAPLGSTELALMRGETPPI